MATSFSYDANGIDNAGTQYHLGVVQPGFEVTQTTGFGPLYSAYIDVVTNHFLFYPEPFLRSVATNTGLTDWKTFVAAFNTAAGLPAPADPYSGDLYDFLYGIFASTLQIPKPITDPNQLGDFTLLAGTIIDNSSAAAAQANINTLFNAMFGKFLQTFRQTNFANLPPSVSPAENAFFLKFGSFASSNTGPDFGLVATTVLDPSTKGAVGYAKLLDYETMFKGFYPNGTDAQFKGALASFVDAAIRNTGYFVPSHYMDQWFRFLEAPSKAILSNPQLILRNDQARIINKVLALLVTMIGSIQKMAIAQSGRLTFLTEFQKSYSDLILQVPTITGGNSTLNSEDRAITNQKAQTTAENLRVQRQIFTDEAKQFQSNLSQTQDASSQQSNLATALLDQMKSILSSIFR